MALPDYALACQVNWTQASAWSPWEQAHANLLCQDTAGRPALVDVALRRGVFYPVIGADTVTIKSLDPGWHLVPRKADSVLSPSPFTGCPLRILRQTALHSGAWVPRFFGYVTKVQPDARAAPRSKATATLTAESPLRYLGARNVTPAPLSAGVPIYSATGDSALQALLRAVGLWVPGMLDLEIPAAEVPLPADWGGQPVQLGQALVDLAFLAHAAIRCIPLYATAAGQPDWKFKWWHPQFDTPALELHAPLGDLWSGATAQWGDEGVP